MKTNNLSQTFVLWRAKNKDPESFAKVYDMLIDPVYRFIYFKVSDPELAKDFAAETFLKAWEYINTEKEIDNLRALIYKIARNMIIDHYRKKSTQDLSLEGDILDRNTDEEDIKNNLTLAEDIHHKMELEKLLELMKQLKDEYREILLLRYVEGFDIKEIASISEKSATNVRVTLHRAHKALEELVK